MIVWFYLYYRAKDYLLFTFSNVVNSYYTPHNLLLGVSNGRSPRSLVQSSHFGTQLLRALHVVTVIKQDVRVINQKIRAKLTFCTDKLYAQSAVPPYLKAFRLSPRRLPSQPALLRRAFTSEATASLSPQPSESHIVRYGACRHSTAADSLIVLYRFSSHQRFMCL